MKIFMIAGEDSGDDLGASLITALHELHGDTVECMGVGGPRMKAAGFRQLLPMDQISVIGIWEVIPKIPRLVQINKAIVEEIEKRQPDVVVTIDFPDFNFILGKSLKKRGVFKGKLVHYVAPSVWAWREGRAKKISTFLDGMLCLFPMEVDYFTKYKMDAKFVGHPIVSTEAATASGEEFREANDIKPGDRVLGVFFGSREAEFKNLSSVLRLSAQLANDELKNIHVIVPTLPRLEYEVQNLIENFGMPVYLTASPLMKWQAFKACDVVVAASGTVGLELAYAGVPHVVVYKVSTITALIVRLMVKVKHVHLANILLKKDIVPEFLQARCTPEKIAQGLLDMFKNEDLRKQQIEEFKALRHMLGGDDPISPSQKAAQFVTDVVKSPKPPVSLMKKPAEPKAVKPKAPVKKAKAEPNQAETKKAEEE